MKVCCGGILGMGEAEEDRVDMLVTLANLSEPPESVPINMLIPIAGTPLAGSAPIAPIEFVRIVALARIMMPVSYVRLSAGRSAMSDEMQALCFFAGANSIFVGDTLLTAGNPRDAADQNCLDDWDCRRSDGLQLSPRYSPLSRAFWIASAAIRSSIGVDKCRRARKGARRADQHVDLHGAAELVDPAGSTACGQARAPNGSRA